MQVFTRQAITWQSDIDSLWLCRLTDWSSDLLISTRDQNSIVRSWETVKDFDDMLQPNSIDSIKIISWVLITDWQCDWQNKQPRLYLQETKWYLLKLNHLLRFRARSSASECWANIHLSTMFRASSSVRLTPKRADLLCLTPGFR